MAEVLVSRGYVWRCLTCGSMDGAYDREQDAIDDGSKHKEKCDASRAGE